MTLRKQLAKHVDIGTLETEIYSDLYNFFSRYYDEGDFMALRRYKDGVYALPYAGEEVKLHWANHDQYYIKTAENFKYYCFTLKSGKKVRFEVVTASTEQNNNKASNGKERRFHLHHTDDNSTMFARDDAMLTIRFEYRLTDKAEKQDIINKDSVAKIFNYLPADYDDYKADLQMLAPTDKDSERSFLAKHLDIYTAKNSFDYFIHKDLGGFLRRELDFYIKNEIMFLDDIENETAPKVSAYLGKIKAIRKVGHILIDFLYDLLPERKFQARKFTARDTIWVFDGRGKCFKKKQ